jgi:hypothetical protein
MRARRHGDFRAESRAATAMRSSSVATMTSDAALARAFSAPLQHRFAGERRAPCPAAARIETRWDDDAKVHGAPSVPAKIVGRKLARIFLEHHGHAIAQRKGALRARTRTCAARWNFSGPLQMGHARCQQSFHP